MPKNDDRKYYLLGLRIAGDFGATIAVPVILFVLIGQWLDERYASGSKFMILGLVLSALLSAKMIHKKAKHYGEEYETIDITNKEDTKKETL
jgi:hypothetical protein